MDIDSSWSQRFLAALPPWSDRTGLAVLNLLGTLVVLALVLARYEEKHR